MNYILIRFWEAAERKSNPRNRHMQLLAYIDLHLRRWQRYGEVRRELATYTNRELDDMGVRRCDIPGIAREAAAMIQPKDKATRTEFAKIAHS
jgi:uncharacterized protein YjiS (DUF1127 family)